MVDEVKINGLYQHYKGMQYRVLGMAKHSETLEWMVYYQCLYENPEALFWVRPLEMFCETVMIKGQVIPRFKLLDGASTEEA
ncbi:MAG: DUF1653 domain-containing protein [Bdellovibrionales bacterium]|nr:DUF1653 domain-containing protein [Bdellovibrionales bacterium]